MNQFPFENLNEDDFEKLIIRICKEIFGVACSTFSKGRDGARDSWFNGTAQYFPSQTNSWKGNFCIQAKHTANGNASCSDNDFSVNESSVLSKEIERLKVVMASTPFDNYIIFTNRKLSGGTYPLIIQKLQKELGIKNVQIIGKEDLNTYLNDYPHIAGQFGLHRFEPLRFYEKDLQHLIVIFANQRSTISEEAMRSGSSFEMIDKEEKNSLNKLSKEYFDFIKVHSLQYFKDIDTFLKAPNNVAYLKMYQMTVSDLQAKIILERERFGDFMHLIEHLIDFVVRENPDSLIDKRDIVRVFIHFMYFNCDIGKIK